MRFRNYIFLCGSVLRCPRGVRVGGEVPRQMRAIGQLNAIYCAICLEDNTTTPILGFIISDLRILKY